MATNVCFTPYAHPIIDERLLLIPYCFTAVTVTVLYLFMVRLLLLHSFSFLIDFDADMYGMRNGAGYIRISIGETIEGLEERLICVIFERMVEVTNIVPYDRHYDKNGCKRYFLVNKKQSCQ